MELDILGAASAAALLASWLTSRRQPPQKPVLRGFDEDFEYIRYLVKFETEMYFFLVVDPHVNANEKIVSDRMMNEAISEVSSRVISAIGSSYRGVISAYVGQGMVDEFVVRLVNASVTAGVVERNRVRIADMTVRE